MPLLSVHPSQLAFVNALRQWINKPVGSFVRWFGITYPTVTLVLVDWQGTEITEPDSAWFVVRILSVSPGFDCETAFPPDSVTVQIGPRKVKSFSDAGVTTETVPCSEVVFSRHWDYEQGTLNSTSGDWPWGDTRNTSGGLYNAGWGGSAFATADTNHDFVGHPAPHIPCEPGDTVALTVLSNNRSGSETSEYLVSWYISTTEVTAFATETLLVVGGHGNSWVQYSGSLPAPAGAFGLAVRFERLSAHDNVTLTVSRSG